MRLKNKISNSLYFIGKKLPEFLKKYLIPLWVMGKTEGSFQDLLKTDIKTVYIDLGKESQIGERSTINGELTVGKYTNVHRNCEFRGPVSIGNYCAIARNVTFQAVDHDYERFSIQNELLYRRLDFENTSKSDEIRVGNDVWIGTSCIILKGVEIGDGAVIGAGSVVTKDVDSFEIVAGNTAEHIGWRFDKITRRELKNSAWWEKEPSQIEGNKLESTIEED